MFCGPSSESICEFESALSWASLTAVCSMSDFTVSLGGSRTSLQINNKI